MPEISTFAKFKDRLLLGLVAAALALLGILHSVAIGRITVLEVKVEASQAITNAHASRLATVEAITLSRGEEIFRRLTRIEEKLDRLNGGK